MALKISEANIPEPGDVVDRVDRPAPPFDDAVWIHMRSGKTIIAHVAVDRAVPPPRHPFRRGGPSRDNGR